jgi:hypothetical protein
MSEEGEASIFYAATYCWRPTIEGIINFSGQYLAFFWF